MSTHPPTSSADYERVTIVLPRKWLDLVDAHNESHGERNRSAAIRRMISAHIGKGCELCPRPPADVALVG